MIRTFFAVVLMLDALVLKKIVQPFAWWCETHVGLSQFGLAYIAIILGCLPLALFGMLIAIVFQLPELLMVLSVAPFPVIVSVHAARRKHREKEVDACIKGMRSFRLVVLPLIACGLLLTQQSTLLLLWCWVLTFVACFTYCLSCVSADDAVSEGRLYA